MIYDRERYVVDRTKLDRLIMRMMDEGVSHDEIAAELGVTKQAVHRISLQRQARDERARRQADRRMLTPPPYRRGYSNWR